MNAVELAELKSCEKVIARTRTNFIECGNALATIRDNRLYRGKFKNFADYCQEKWGFGRSHAYRMIDAAVTAELSPMGDKIENERQARKLRDAERKSKVAAVGDDVGGDASASALEATATPDAGSGPGTAPDPEPASGETSRAAEPRMDAGRGMDAQHAPAGENEGGGASTREGEANSGPVQGSAEPPPPRVMDESTTEDEKDAAKAAVFEATDDASDGDGPAAPVTGDRDTPCETGSSRSSRSTGGPEPDEEPRAPHASSGSNSAGSSARVAGPEPRRVPPASGSGTGRKRQQANQDRGREIVTSHRQVSVSERPVEYVEAYFAAHQSELPEFVAGLELEGEQVAELLAALRPLAKAVQ